MQLDYAVHPLTKAVYTFPRRQMKLAVPNPRRNPVFVVPGGGGPINPKGSAPFDRDVNVITYQFRLLPRADGTTLDALYDQFLIAVDHGLPQTLAFLADDGRHWTVPAALVRKPYGVDTNGADYVDLQADWVLLADYLETVPTNSAIFGHYAKFGHHVKFGGAGTVYPLAANPTTFVVDNTGNAATAATGDPSLTLTGPFGPAAPDATSVIAISCAESKTSLTIPDNVATATDKIELDFASRRVLKNGQPAFALNYPGRPSGQAGFLQILPNSLNTITVSYTGTGVAAPAGKLRLKWKPKRSL